MDPAFERSFRIIAVAEATSFLALLVATYVKYAQEQPGGVEVLGPVHGVLFLAYVGLAFYLAPRAGWGIGTTVLVVAGAVAPFGGYVVDRWLARRSLHAAG